MSSNYPPPDPRYGRPAPAPPEVRVPRDEVAATLAARSELGPAYEPALVDRLAYEVDRVVEAQTVRRLHLARETKRRANHALALGISSVVAGIPLTAIAGSLTDLPGVLITWAGIVGINVAHSLSQRKQQRD